MNEPLNEYIKYCELFYINSFTIVLDMDLNVVFVGEKYLNVINKTRQEVLGKPLYLTTPIPEHNRNLSKIAFPEAIQNKQTKQVFISNLYHPYPDSHILMLLFSPILNKEDNVIASRLDFTPVDISYFLQILINANPKITPCEIPSSEQFLTKREHQIAFLLCHCRSTLEITQVLNLFNTKSITQKTVHNIISRYLFVKFEVKTRSKLILKLFENGYDKNIPNSLLSNQFIDLTKKATIN